MERCLVTGGAGFIGSNIVKELCRRGHEVVVLDDLSSGNIANLAPFPQARFVRGSICDQDALSDAMAGVQVVFHLAASVGNKRSIDFPMADSEINMLGTLRVLETCRKNAVRKLVFSSSAGIFGELKQLPIRTDHPAEPDTPYGASKLGAEKMCLAYTKIHGLETVCLRYFNVYGPNQRFDAYGNVIPIFVFKMLAGEPVTIFGDGEQTRDFINVRDVVQANLKGGFASGVWGAFNVGSGTNIAINRLVRMIQEIGRFSGIVQHAAPRPGDVRDSIADIQDARRAFDFAPSVEMQEGLTEYIAWARRLHSETGMSKVA